MHKVAYDIADLSATIGHLPSDLLMTQPRFLRLFISYAHKDDSFRRQLETQLSPLKRQGLVEIWSDRAIEAGQEWEQSISQQLKTADIILLLISPDFLASEFIYENELTQAIERHKAGEARVIPVFLRPCDWKGEVFGKLQGVPDNAKPISLWKDHDEAFEAAARAIRQVAQSLRSLHPEPEEKTPHPSPQMTEASFRPLETSINSSILRVEYADISTLNVDVIVSSDDTTLQMGGGVSWALWQAGGPEVWREVKALSPIKLGDIVITTAGRLKAKKIFHPAVLDYDRPNLTTSNLIRAVTKKCLGKCNELGFQSIAFPALATGAAGLSPERSAVAMMIEIAAYLSNASSIISVVIAIYPRPGRSRDILTRFYSRINEFLEVIRKVESITTALNNLESVYRGMEIEEAAKSVAVSREHLMSHRVRWEREIQEREPGDLVEDSSNWLRYRDEMESDLERTDSLRNYQSEVETFLNRQRNQEFRNNIETKYREYRYATLVNMIDIRRKNITDLEQELARRGFSVELNRKLEYEKEALKHLEDDLREVE